MTYLQDESGKQHTVYFPSLRSIQLRLDAFAAEGLGVSIWELGQGLERFFNLL
jgi:chitinase domain-containing protein 1